jgi:predicted PurR-regulated permease PerM
VGFFALLAWLNCHAIECWESGRCERGRFGSAFGQSRRSRVFLPAGLLGLLGLLLTAVLFQIQPRSAGLVATGAVSALLLALLDRFRHHFTSLALRAAADLVLLCPAVLLLRG